MIRKYVDLLPSYLRGENIQKHGGIIDKLRERRDNNLFMLRNAFNLARPILFEVDDENTSDITVHINPGEVIKKITIIETNSIEQSFDDPNCEKTEYPFTEDEIVTSQSITFSLDNNSKCLVVVETFNEHTLKKAYPEDEILGEYHAHDEFLDNIGNLYSIQRFTGETDFDYLARLNYFREHMNTTDDMALLMLRVIYNITDPALELFERETSLPGYLVNLQNAWMITNIPTTIIDEVQALLDKYTPITRKIVVRRPFSTHLGGLNPMDYMPDIVHATGEQSPWFPNTTLIIPAFSPKLVNAPVSISLDNTTWDEYSNIDGWMPLKLYGLLPGSHTLDLVYYGEDEIEGSDLTFRFTSKQTVARQEACWQKGEYNGYVDNFVEPSFPTSPPGFDEEYLDCGAGYLLYTPIINYDYVDKDNFCVYGEFDIHYSNQRLGIVQVTETDGTVKENGLFVNLANYIRESPPNEFCFDFVDGEIYFYLDGESVGVRRDIRLDEGVWYLAAYNANPGYTFLLDSMYTGAAMFGAYPEINHKYWYVITGTGNRRAPEYDSTNDMYDVGRKDISVLTDYTIFRDTVDTTIEIEFNTQTTTDFRIGLVLNKTTTIGWYDSFFNATNDNVTTGNHTLKFVADENGVWKTYIDNNRTSTAEFTLTNNRNIGVINYQAQAVKIKGIRIYKN